LRGPFSTVSTPILQANTRFKALDAIYKVYTLLRLLNPIWNPRKPLLRSIILAARPGGRREKSADGTLRWLCKWEMHRFKKNGSLRCGTQCPVSANVNCADSRFLVRKSNLVY